MADNTKFRRSRSPVDTFCYIPHCCEVLRHTQTRIYKHDGLNIGDGTVSRIKKRSDTSGNNLSFVIRIFIPVYPIPDVSILTQPSLGPTFQHTHSSLSIQTIRTINILPLPPQRSLRLILLTLLQLLHIPRMRRIIILILIHLLDRFGVLADADLVDVRVPALEGYGVVAAHGVGRERN